MKVLYSLIFLSLLISCNSTKKQEKLSSTPKLSSANLFEEDSTNIQLERKNNTINHAKGFSISDFGNYKLLEITNALYRQNKIHRYVLITKKQAMVTTFNRDAHDGIITIPIERIAINNAEHAAIINSLNASNSIVENNVSKNSEIVLSKHPNLIVISGANGIDEKLEPFKKAYVPVIYTGEWKEKSKLAKEEWRKLFAALYMQ